MSPPDPDPPHAPVRWWVCGLLLLATTINYMDRVALNQTGVEVKAAFGLGPADWGWIEAAFSVAFALGTVAAGWLVDRVGVYWVYPALVVGWSCAGFLSGFAVGFFSLLAFRFLLGLFEAGNWPCGIRTTRQVLPPAERPFGNSLFQSGTAFGAVLTPVVVLVCLGVLGPGHPDLWRWLFRVIGLIGLVWVAGWFLIVPRALVRLPPATGAEDSLSAFFRLFRERRYWLVVVVVIAVNTSWHTFRAWMPFYLREQRGFSAEDLQSFAIAYYVSADVGTWTIGYAILRMNRAGRSHHSSRMVGFLTSVLFVLVSLLLPVLSDAYLIAAVLLLFAFGALALFTAYFSLSQELSSAHQGKVTGSLGFINAIYLAGMYVTQGYLSKWIGRYEPILAVAGLPALVAFVLVLHYWDRPAKSPLDAAAGDVLPL